MRTQHLRRALRFLLLTLLLGAALAAAAEADGAEARERKFLFVGDSYAVVREGVNRPWPELFQSLMGIPASESLYARAGGYGFAKTDHQFISLIRMHKKNTAVTDIVIMGGVGNDRLWSPQSIRKSCKAFTKLCRARFPNARIIYSMCNWRIKNTKIQKQILARIPVYKRAAAENGWIYLPGLEKTLRGHPEYFQKDNHHPTQAGQYVIATKLAKAYRTYCVSGVYLNAAARTMTAGKKAKLIAVVAPATALEQTVVWKSSRPSVAKVSKNGVVTAVKAGTAVITVKTKDGGFKTSCKITVKAPAKRT